MDTFLVKGPLHILMIDCRLGNRIAILRIKSLYLLNAVKSISQSGEEPTKVIAERVFNSATLQMFRHTIHYLLFHLNDLTAMEVLITRSEGFIVRLEGFNTNYKYKEHARISCN